jgi:hypothetical protein
LLQKVVNSLGSGRVLWINYLTEYGHNIKTDFRENGWDDMVWVDLAKDMNQYRLCDHLAVP